MPVLGLTGGIASGKSTVARMFAGRGAMILDADAVARELVVAGEPALEEIAARFGPGVMAPDGSLDRPALGSLIFSDRRARADLDAILHPRVFFELRQRIGRQPPEALQVVEAALLVETAARADDELNLEALIVVECEVEQQVSRAMSQRGLSEAEARARVDAQASPARRRAAADHVIDNSGSLAQLARAFEDLWERLRPRL